MLCKKLEQQVILEDVSLPEAVQVKEKLGGLRFYVVGEAQAMLDIIDESETKSETICEVCGYRGERFSDQGRV